MIDHVTEEKKNKRMYINNTTSLNV